MANRSVIEYTLMKSIEIFAGAGGLALGSAKAGFKHEALLERDAASCLVLRQNIARKNWKFGEWKVLEGDIQNHEFSLFRGQVDLVSGGPPCQPFSIGGKHKGYDDSRDMFPQAARVVSEVAPKAFVFENVSGLLRESFSQYFQYIILRLAYPDETNAPGESWQEHLNRLERIHTSARYPGLHYKILYRLLNAANYGVPQKRRRVFIVGFRADIAEPWSFPIETHSEAALLVSKWVTRDYWDENRIASKDRPSITEVEEKKVWRLIRPVEKRWRTVRDAISGLPDPSSFHARRYQAHRFQPGARSYPGHTGSNLDMPAKTLKAGDHGVPGGENMIAFPDGSFRYFTIRESARLQTFPDDYLFPTSWTESMRQIGNAVPVTLAEIVMRSVQSALTANSNRSQSKALPSELVATTSAALA